MFLLVVASQLHIHLGKHRAFCFRFANPLQCSQYRIYGSNKQCNQWPKLASSTARSQSTNTLHFEALPKPKHEKIMWKIRFMFVEKLSKRCCITIWVLYKYSELRWSLADSTNRVTEWQANKPDWLEPEKDVLYRLPRTVPVICCFGCKYLR